MTPQQRYKQAHHDYMMRTAKDFYELSGGWKYKLTMPKVKTANGLTDFICNYLNWCGHRATRVNVMGRMIDRVEVQPSGTRLKVKKYIPSTTRKGTADISATINGRSVMLEIKVGRDRPSEYQLAEQQRERAAGGVYEFVKTPEEFFMVYDRIVGNVIN